MHNFSLKWLVLVRLQHNHPDQERLFKMYWLSRCSLLVQVHVSWIDSGTAVFSFRGTESTKDGLQDLKFVRRNIDYLQRAYPGAKAHTGAVLLRRGTVVDMSCAQAFMQLSFQQRLKCRSTVCGRAGFLQQFAAVVDESRPGMHLGKVLAELSGGRKPNRVLCTGHSLGGALATLGKFPSRYSNFIGEQDFCSKKPLRPHNLATSSLLVLLSLWCLCFALSC